MGGEPTRLYKATSEDAGGFILSYEERTRDGPKLSDRRETVVDQYDQPVDIQPPLNVPPAADGNASAGCLELGDDFPWIPAAIAAVLGPLLFLAASAFVWPRRL